MTAVQLNFFVLLILGIVFYGHVSGTDEEKLVKDLIGYFGEAIRLMPNNAQYLEFIRANDIRPYVKRIYSECSEVENEAATSDARRQILCNWLSALKHTGLAKDPLIFDDVKGYVETMDIACNKSPPNNESLKKAVELMREYIDRSYFYVFLQYLNEKSPSNSKERKTLDQLYSIFYRKNPRPVNINPTLKWTNEHKDLFFRQLAKEFSNGKNKHITTLPETHREALDID